MKVITSKQTDTIDLSEVTEDMYFVGTYDGKSANILTRDGNFGGKFSFRCIPTGFTNGNRASVSGTIKECIEHYLSQCGCEVHAFKDYKEAFKFIAENL